MIDQLAKDVFTTLQSKAEHFKELPESHIRVLLESAMRKLNLVSREEFDTQQAVLLRTREKVESLEAQLAELIKQLEDTQK